MSVLVGVMLAGLFGVMLGMHVMAMRDVRVMTSLVMIARLVMIGGRAMVLRGVFMMLGSFTMVLSGLIGHSLASEAMIQSNHYAPITNP